MSRSGWLIWGQRFYPLVVALLAALIWLPRWGADSSRPLPADSPLRVVLRYDDLTSQTAWEPEERLIEVCRRHGLRATLAVIPALLEPADTRKLSALRSAAAEGVIEIAQHGWDHYYRIDYPRERTELVGRPAADQMQRIERGRQRLEEYLETRVTTFIPPWNSYDATTVGALRKLQFATLSAGRRGLIPGPGRPLYVLPATCEALELRRAVAEMRAAGQGGVLVVQWHPYDFAPRGPVTLAELDETLAWLAAQSDVVGATVDEAARQGATPRTLLGNRWIATAARLLPPILRGPHVVELGYYTSRPVLIRASAEGAAGVLLGYLLVPLGLWLWAIGRWRHSAPVRWGWGLAQAALMLGWLAMLSRGIRLDWPTLLGGAWLGWMCLALVAAGFRRLKRRPPPA